MVLALIIVCNRLPEDNNSLCLNITFVLHKSSYIMDFDEVLIKYIGEMGTYQILVLLVGTSVTINNTFGALEYIFSGATPKFRCDFGELSSSLKNLTFDDLATLASPPDARGYGWPDPCWIKNYNYSSLSAGEAQWLLELNETSVSIEKCQRWVYSKEQFTATIVTKWDLVCDRKWLVATSQSVFMAGQFSIFIGAYFADRFGRRPVCLVCLCLNIAARCLIAFSPNVYIFVIGRFVLSCVWMSCYLSIFMLSMECVGPRWRVFAGQLPWVFWSLGYLMLSGLAYLVRDWTTLTLILTAFSLPYLIQFCLLKESVRWYNTKKKTAEALDLVQKMAKVNKRKIPDEVLRELFNEQINKELEFPQAKVIDLLKSWPAMKMTVYLSGIWFSIICVYYGLVFYLPELGGNIYISTAISGALELPALVYVQLTSNTRLGRRLNCLLTLMLTGTVLLTLIWIPKEYTWLSISLALIGRFANTALFSMIYIYTSELYPTVWRSAGLSVCNIFSRVGSVVAPQIAFVGMFAVYLPPVLFGSMSIVAAMLCLLLPETRGENLKDTVALNDPDLKHGRSSEGSMDKREPTVSDTFV